MVFCMVDPLCLSLFWGTGTPPESCAPSVCALYLGILTTSGGQQISHPQSSPRTGGSFGSGSSAAATLDYNKLKYGPGTFMIVVLLLGFRVGEWSYSKCLASTVGI